MFVCSLFVEICQNTTLQILFDISQCWLDMLPNISTTHHLQTYLHCHLLTSVPHHLHPHHLHLISSSRRRRPVWLAWRWRQAVGHGRRRSNTSVIAPSRPPPPQHQPITWMKPEVWRHFRKWLQRHRRRRRVLRWGSLPRIWLPTSLKFFKTRSRRRLHHRHQIHRLLKYRHHWVCIMYRFREEASRLCRRKTFRWYFC